ncbi:hypothetical protein IGI04_030250 [Brassica rapa subsp. trilocularis]|uniref:Uncharacterized protein n=1 Tax=Brassica rapa subsp. trilocularis TaxID=1813537 RepID=A0ABQ7LTH9_BRACM|nr:hypothetical protein IGI04_030250 [Brassica rapa subsp. trilocularis]
MHKLCKDARITSAGLYRYATQAPDQFNKHKTMLVKKRRRIVGLCNQKSNWKTDETRPRPCKRENLNLGAKRSTGKFAGKVPGKFTGDNPAIDLNPALDSGGPNSPTLRTRTVRYTRTSVCVRQHTQDVRGRPSAHTGRFTAISTHINTSGGRLSGDLATWLSVQSNTRTSVRHTQDVRGCPCVSDYVGHTHRNVRAAQQDSVSTARTLWLSVCVRGPSSTTQGLPSVPQDVRQHQGRPWPSVVHRGLRDRPSSHTEDSVQYTEYVRGRFRQHTTGRPSSINKDVCGRSAAPQEVRCLHKGRSVSTQQDVLSTAQDVRGRPSVHIISRPWPFSVDLFDDFGPRGLSVQKTTQTGKSVQHTHMLTTHISMACRLTVDCPLLI